MGSNATDDRTRPEGAFTVAAFYKFVAIDDPARVRDDLFEVCEVNGIKGTILVAPEGVNATVSGSAEGIAHLVGALRAHARLQNIDVKYSYASAHPFQRLKVKIKPEIVTLGRADLSPAVETATAVEPEDWNALISRPDVLVVDTRNDYEVEIGSFPGAINPETRAFSDFPDFVERQLAENPTRPIAMFCTGGIRCEKASAYLLSRGFSDVYQLRGGILRYLERVAPENSLWQGECFVFDERVAVAEGVRQGQHALCETCGRPVKVGEDVCGGATCENAGTVASHRRDVGVL